MARRINRPPYTPLSRTARPVPAVRRAVAAQAAVRALAVFAALVYLAGMSAYLLTHGGWPTPDYLIPPLLLVAIALGRGWPFVLDWGPFLLLVLSWQATAGIADELGRPVHVSAPINADRWLFGGAVPTLWLQDRLFTSSRASWYDWFGTVQHAFHFVLPVATGMVIWTAAGRRMYWRYLASVMALFYLGFVGYALYPTAPPWMAGLQGVIEPVHRVAIETVLRLPSSAPIGLAYNHMNANPVAAMPSLHAALPLLLALVLIRLWGWRAAPSLLYPLTMGFNLVYLGEHWVVDVLAGYLVALLAYAMVWLAPDMLAVRLPRVSFPAPRLGRPWRVAGNAALPAVAALSLAVILFSLRPGRPATEAGPVVPGLQVHAGREAPLQPVPCALGSATSLTAGTYLLPVSGKYAAFLYDLDETACYSLSANVSFAAPEAERVAGLAARAPVRLAPLGRPRPDVEYYALRAGQPAAAIVEAGLPVGHRYLLIITLAEVADVETAAQAVDALADLVIVSPPAEDVAPPPEPAPEPEPDAPPPVQPAFAPAPWGDDLASLLPPPVEQPATLAPEPEPPSEPEPEPDAAGPLPAEESEG